MVISDLRHVAGYTELIAISSSVVRYATEALSQGSCSFSINEHDPATNTAKTISAPFSFSPNCFCRFWQFSDLFLVLLYGTEGQTIELIQIDRKTGREQERLLIPFYGSFSACLAPDENHLLLYTRENETNHSLFARYRSLTGFSYLVSLFDILEKKLYWIKDSRICTTFPEHLLFYDLNGQKQLLLLQTCDNEAEKEYLYQQRKWLETQIHRDNIWLSPVLDFLVSAKSGETHLPLEPLLSTDSGGFLRFSGMTKTTLYFRGKRFSDGAQGLLSIDKLHKTPEFVASLHHIDPRYACYYYMDTPTAKAYRILDRGNVFEVTGILNTQANLLYRKELGELVACIEDRYVITRLTLQRKGRAVVCHAIYDAATRKHELYEGRLAFHGSHIVLY